MKPIFIISAPCSNAERLVEVLNTSGGAFAGESRDFFELLNRAQSATGQRIPEVWAGIADRMLQSWCGSTDEQPCGLVSIYHGREDWKAACGHWSALLETWPDARLIFLTRDQGEIELAMLTDLKPWIPSYGNCTGCLGGRVRQFHHSMADFALMNPSRSMMIDSSDLSSPETMTLLSEWTGVSISALPLHSTTQPQKSTQPAPQVETAFAPAGYQPKAPKKFIERKPLHARAIVYPWLSIAGAWGQEELRHSLRSVIENFEDKECPIYIIGDAAPDWFQEGGRVRFLRMEGYRSSRERGLFQAFSVGLQIADLVCWMNDDIYYLRPTSWDDLATALTEGELGSSAEDLLTSENSWRRAMGEAVLDLRHQGHHGEIMRFATHTPYLFERRKSVEVLKKYHIPFKGGWVQRYHVEHSSPHRPIGKEKSTTLPAHPQSRFLNHCDETLTPTLKRRIAELFPYPAPWEKTEVEVISPGPAEESRVPKIIHQTWRDRDIPHQIYPAAWQQSWRDHHPDWKYRLWTDADILELARRHYAWAVPALLAHPGVIRADIGRLLVLHRNGGVYADLDYQALKPIDSLLVGGKAFVSSIVRGPRLYIHNALVAGEAGEMMFLELAHIACERAMDNPQKSPEWISGPTMFTRFAADYRPVHLPAKLVCPIDWQDARANWEWQEANAAANFPDAHAVTWWKHGW